MSSAVTSSLGTLPSNLSTSHLPSAAPLIFSSGRVDYLDRALTNTIGQEQDCTIGDAIKLLQECRQNFSEHYQKTLIDPLIKFLNGYSLTYKLSGGGAYCHLVQSIFQRCEKLGHGVEIRDSVFALQGMVCDFYFNFFDTVERWNIKRPDFPPSPPIVVINKDEEDFSFVQNVSEWSMLSCSPHVAADPAAWTLLYEEIGYETLRADKNLPGELERKVCEALSETDPSLASYWKTHFKSAVSNVVGTLNLGPAFAIGLLIRLKSQLDDERSPEKFLRGMLASSVLSLLKKDFSQAELWSTRIMEETQRSIPNTMSCITPVLLTEEKVKQSVDVVAKTIVEEGLVSLDGYSFGSIRKWDDDDAERSEYYQHILSDPKKASLRYGDAACHVFSGAILASVKENADIDHIHSQMMGVLSELHQQDKQWFSSSPQGSKF